MKIMEDEERERTKRKRERERERQGGINSREKDSTTIHEQQKRRYEKYRVCITVVQ